MRYHDVTPRSELHERIKQLEAGNKAQAERIAQLEEQKRAVICIHCGQIITYITENIANAYNTMLSHDKQCSANPLVQRIAKMEYDLAIIHEHTNLADCAEDEHFRDAIKMIRKRTAPYENLKLTAGPIYSGEDNEQAELGGFKEWWKSYGTYDDANLDYHIAAAAWNARQTEIDRLNAEKKAIQELAIGKMQAALDYPEASIDILHIGITELKKEGKPTPEEILRRGGLLNKLITENEKLKNGCHELLLKQDELTSEKEAQAQLLRKTIKYAEEDLTIIEASYIDKVFAEQLEEALKGQPKE